LSEGIIDGFFIFKIHLTCNESQLNFKDKKAASFRMSQSIRPTELAPTAENQPTRYINCVIKHFLYCQALA